MGFVLGDFCPTVSVLRMFKVRKDELWCSVDYV